MKNFKSEIGCVIVFKMLIYRKIRGYLEMTNENVRFFSSFFSYKNTYTFKPAILSSKFFSLDRKSTRLNSSH